jgi:hypothetical protein
VDGTLIGVGDFDEQPSAHADARRAPHNVVADGYEPLTFDADVMPGQVIPSG